MYKQLIEYFIHIALMHKAVSHAKYQNRIYTNAQNNNKYFQFNIDCNPYFDTLVSTPNIPFVMSINVDIIGFLTKDYTLLQCQSDALQIGIEFLQYLRDDRTFAGQLAIRDYQFLGIEGFTDDNSAGQRMTVQFVIPNYINLCEYSDNFSEDFVPEEPTDVPEFDVTDPNPPSEINDLVLKPILLPTR